MDPMTKAFLNTTVEALNPPDGGVLVFRLPAGLHPDDARTYGNLLFDWKREWEGRWGREVTVLILPDGYDVQALTRSELQHLGLMHTAEHSKLNDTATAAYLAAKEMKEWAMVPRRYWDELIRALTN